MKNPVIVFMGSPNYAVPSLRALTEKFHVVGVITQPDRPAGRGRKLKAPPVKDAADDLGISLLQPQRLHKDPEAMAQLKAWNPDLIVVAAFAQILKPAVLDQPKFGCLNVHGSLLPRWRGAAPLNAAILAGDQETGVTIMKMDPGLDTGPMVSKRVIPIGPQDTAGSLMDVMAEIGAALLIETIPPYIKGELTPKPQDESLATYAPMLQRSDGELDFNLPAVNLARQVRAYHPWPGTFFIWSSSPFKVHAAHALGQSSPGIGVLTIHDGFPCVGTSEGILVLDQVQPAGKQSMPGDVFLHGAKKW
jgi:methionyl-tRNA formyltransferase